jgi:hypothetical protein
MKVAYFAEMNSKIVSILKDAVLAIGTDTSINKTQ